MAANRIFNHKVIIVVCLAVFMCGCAQQAQQPPEASKPAGPPVVSKPVLSVAERAEPASVAIALKPTAGEQTRYRIATHASKSINWEGPVPEKKAFEENFNDEQVEMVITQRIQSVDSEGRAAVQVTIDQMKYRAIIKSKPAVDFDSTRQSDANSPLAVLMRQRYTIEVEPNNYVSSVSGLGAVVAGVSGQTAADRTGQGVLSQKAAAERHMTLLLPRTGEEQLKLGDKWSRVKTFEFGLMGLKSYEKIYTLKEIRDEAGHQIAAIDMSAIPTSEVEEKYRNQQGADFPKKFDTDETYKGSGEVDLTAGCINSYREKLQTNWTAAFPPNHGATEDVNEPVVLRMTAAREYNLERIK